MSHHHDHGNCGNESHSHDHDHDHNTSDLGPQDNLYIHIDRPNVVALNTNGKGQDVIKPWHERLDESISIESDADDQIIVRIPFTGSVRLRSVLLKTGPTDQTPSKVLLYANTTNLDFDDVASQKPTQEFVVAQGRDVGEYAVKTTQFSNISSLTLFFPESQGAETTQVYYIGLLGHWTERKNNPVVTVYETQANIADHPKIQGMDGMFSRPGM
ncbi:UPF0424 protein [Termitomyces sp. J132]|nr:hypothetical protein H2248_006125 [Termitomyces sp. 'cryptogamus']KNZ73852.1 UPF0424 protein [Termitomyces sp. J132]